MGESMTRSRLFLLLGVVVVLLLGAGAGAWWYLFGANAISAAALVPGDTVAFATVPNAAEIVKGYQTSRLKQLGDSPNARPIIDSITNLIGQKNIEVINAFLPNLSGQSFIAVTRFDPDKPAEVGFIAGMKPKAGMGDFAAFVEKLKATWPEFVKLGKTGTGNIAGVDYQWIQGPGAPDKLCVAQFHGWIITTWGEASLQDWIERFQKKSSTPSLAQNPDYQKSISRVGKDPMTLVYVNYHAVADILQKQMAKTNRELAKINPAMPKMPSSDYLFKRLGEIGGAAMGTRFENGEIVDRYSILMSRQAQIDSSMSATPCPFETLNFTGPDTLLYWATSINWQQYWKNMQEQMKQMSSMTPTPTSPNDWLQTWAKGAGVDVQHNIIDALGSEISIQAEWSADAPFPEAGLFVKLDKPDDFKPVITAIIEAARKAYATSAVIQEIHFGDHNFATLKFVQTSPVNPTITEDGPYLGIFLTQNQAVRSFQRDETLGLVHNADFIRQIGDKRKGASQILFLDSPQLLDRGYRTAMPYLSLASMFMKNLPAFLNSKDMPADLTWLAPMGTWSYVMSSDDAGIQGYSVSGVGNQGIFLVGASAASAGLAQYMGLFPKPNASGASPLPGNPANTTNPSTPPVPPANDTSSPTNEVTAPPSPAENEKPQPTPNASTNAMIQPTNPTSTNEEDEASPEDMVDSAKSSAPAPASDTNSAPSTNSDATAPTPEPTE